MGNPWLKGFWALLRLISDGELRNKLGAAGKQRAFTLFNPERLAAQYQELYLSVLTEKTDR